MINNLNKKVLELDGDNEIINVIDSWLDKINNIIENKP